MPNSIADCFSAEKNESLLFMLVGAGVGAQCGQDVDQTGGDGQHVLHRAAELRTHRVG